MVTDKGGAPIGNKNATKGAIARNALLKAIERRSTGTESELPDKFSALVAIWDAQIEKAIAGDTPAATMIVDRLDGKPKQAIVGGEEDDNPIRITRIELVAMNADSAD